jgi:hopene-associated glycosyltransferase HpnB
MWHSLLTAAALAALGIWLGLIAVRGGFWRARIDEHLAPSDDAACAGVRVEALVPARNESATIAAAMRSLVTQRFAGTLHLTVIDDHSEDGTAEAARAERVSVVPARELAQGWTGKLNALDSGVAAVRAARGAPDYWLLTDADIVHEGSNLARLVSTAERDRLEIVSSMVHLNCASPWERLLIPAFVFFFQKLYPFAWVNDPKRRTAAAAGGCILLANAALERVGGFATIADRLIDDCALAAAVKRSGGNIRLGLSDQARSIRVYLQLADVWAMVKRSAFEQLGHSYLKLALTVAGMLVLYAVGPLAALAGATTRDPWLGLAGAAAWLAAAGAYAPTLRAYRQPLDRALSLPFAATLYTAMTIDSALAHARRRGGGWKGRVRSLSATPSR